MDLCSDSRALLNAHVFVNARIRNTLRLAFKKLTGGVGGGCEKKSPACSRRLLALTVCSIFRLNMARLAHCSGTLLACSNDGPVVIRVSLLIIRVPVLNVASRKDAELAFGDKADTFLLSGVTRIDTGLNSSPSNGSDSLNPVGRMAGLFQAGIGWIGREGWSFGSVLELVSLVLTRWRPWEPAPRLLRCTAGRWGMHSLVNPSKRGRRGVHPTRPDPHPAFDSPGVFSELSSAPAPPLPTPPLQSR